MDRQTDRETDRSLQPPAALQFTRNIISSPSCLQTCRKRWCSFSPWWFFPCSSSAQLFPHPRDLGMPHSSAWQRGGWAGSCARLGHGGFMESEPWAHPGPQHSSPTSAGTTPKPSALPSPKGFQGLLGLGNTRFC